MKSGNKWHCIKGYTTKKRRETDPEFVEKKRERDRQLYHEKKKVKEENGEIKNYNYNRKYHSENIMLIAPVK